MSGRASKKTRRLSTDSEGEEDGYGWVGLEGKQAKSPPQYRPGSAAKGDKGKNQSVSFALASILFILWVPVEVLVKSQKSHVAGCFVIVRCE